MNLHLALPDLLWPLVADRAVVANLPAPALELLLARGRRTPGAVTDIETWLLDSFAAGSGGAPFALRADGGDPAGGVWMRADPCHLHADRDRLLLADASTFDVEPDEAQALIDALNAHFAADGMRFCAPQPTHWYVQLRELPTLHTTPLRAARGRDIDALLPAGETGKHWHALWNEMQMLLYQHPVNDARELRGAPTINSVWLWGAGRDAAPARRPYARVRSDDSLARGLGMASGAAITGTPADAHQWLHDAGAEGVELVVLDQLALAADYGDAHAWRSALQALERDWFAPLLAALRGNRLAMLTLHACGTGATFDIETTRQDLRHFWRRPHALASYAGETA